MLSRISQRQTTVFRLPLVLTKKRLPLISSSRVCSSLLSHPSLAASIAKAEVKTSGLVVHWDLTPVKGTGGEGSVEEVEDLFPLIYLRDNCLQDWQVSTNSRITEIAELDEEAKSKPVALEVEASGKSLSIEWGDGRLSTYSNHWLRTHSLSAENREKRRDVLRVPSTTWSRDYMRQNLPTFPFQTILSDDVFLHDWLQATEQLGLVILKDAALEPGQLLKLAERVAFVKETHYGVTFEVKSKANPSNVAYTNGKLPLHVDLPQLENQPGIQCLHCIAQSSQGGANIFVDGFEAARLLKVEKPEYWQILTNTDVEFADVNDDHICFHMVARHRTIELDAAGEYERVNVNNHIRSSYLDLPVDRVEAFYQALIYYNQILNRDDLRFHYLLQPGDIAVFNNVRVLHGREAYETTAGDSDRWLEGCYFDSDMFRSRLRITKRNLGYSQPVLTAYK